MIQAMGIPKPADVYDRVHEWSDLQEFVTDPAPGLRLGIVRGRRRHGKSFLLEHLCQAVHGTYTLALRQSRAMALERFGEELSRRLGFRSGRFTTWTEALDTAVDALLNAPGGDIPLLVMDELPYLVANSPELPSALQALYDQRGPSTGHPPFRIILCGSAVSAMSTLVSGDQALRGRAVIDMSVGPFRYRDAADFWGCDPQRAFLVDAVLGGSPGYRDIVGEPPADVGSGFTAWLGRSLMNPSHVLFNEPDYLLAEDPGIGDRAIYHAIWQAVAQGRSSPTQIGGLVGMDAKSLGYHLTVMREAGFINYGHDLLKQRHPIITVADPAVRFHNLIVRPYQLELEMRESEWVWDRSRDVFAGKVLGPHFEELARQWTRWYGREAGLTDIGNVGSAVISCREHSGHEIDVIALDRLSAPRGKGSTVAFIGEAQCTSGPRGRADLARLEHIRDVLVVQGWKAAGASLGLFSRHGFSPEMTERRGDDHVHLVDLAGLYG
jgi:hypothetical protein